jgi:hypothetical protein
MTRRRVLWAVAAVAALAAVALAAVALRSNPGRTRPHQLVGVDATTLRDAFNADHGSVRVLALVSPTCGACLLGASDLQRDVFAAIPDPRLPGVLDAPAARVTGPTLDANTFAEQVRGALTNA